MNSPKKLYILILLHYSILPFSIGATDLDSIEFSQKISRAYSNYRTNINTAKQQLYDLLTTANHTNNFCFIVRCQNKIGELFLKGDQIDSASIFFQKSLQLKNKPQTDLDIASTYEGLAKAELAIGENNSALKYLYLSLATKRRIGNSDYLKSLYTSIGNVHLELVQHDSAILYHNKALNIYLDQNDTQGIAASYMNFGNMHYYLEDDAQAINFYKQSHSWYKLMPWATETIDALINTAISFNNLGFTDSSLYYLNLALSASKKNGTLNQKKLIYELKAETFNEVTQHDSAIKMYQKHLDYQDSLYQQNKQNIILEIREKIGLEETELAFKNEKIKSSTLTKTIIFLSGIIITIIILIVLLLRNIRQKRRMQNLEIDQLLKNQEAKSYAALIEGQNTERQRIANDLHDRLAGNLATIKMQFEHLNEKVDTYQSENKSQFNKVNDLLEEAVKDVRNISHDLTSGKLIELGLKASLEDLGNIISSAKNIEMTPTINAPLPTLPPKTEQALYAMIQEMVSNTLKHAQANYIDLQITAENNLLNIVYEDDGVGFVYKDKLDKGLGLQSMQQRVAKLEGTIQYDIVVGRGTIIIINIPYD